MALALFIIARCATRCNLYLHFCHRAAAVSRVVLSTRVILHTVKLWPFIIQWAKLWWLLAALHFVLSLEPPNATRFSTIYMSLAGCNSIFGYFSERGDSCVTNVWNCLMMIKKS